MFLRLGRLLCFDFKYYNLKFFNSIKYNMTHTNRVILLIDMDCFFCQVEENLDPTLKGKPLAVVQYNEWRGGGIIAVNYPAREKGVTRHMRGDDAREKCPDIILPKVPQVRGKADLSKYRDAGKRVADVLQMFTTHMERASVDEAYLDITEVVEKKINDKSYSVTVDKLPNTFVVGSSTADFIDNVTSSREYNESNFKLAVGGIIAEEIRAEVYKITGYKCSAGIAHNKILAKLVCGLHKPDKQTILPHEAVPELYEKLPIRKVKSLGGKFGNAVAEKLGIEHMGELVRFTQKELTKKFDEKSGCWLYNIARGIDTEPVNTRLISKSIGCCKKFPGKSALLTPEDVEHWLSELAEEIAERVQKDFEENNRRPKQMVVSFAQETNGEEVSSTRTHPLHSYEQSKIFENALKVIQKNCLKADGSYIIIFLGISVGNFQDVKKVKEITSFFQNMRNNLKKEKVSDDTEVHSGIEPTFLEINNSVDSTSNGHLEAIPEIIGNKESSPRSDSIYSDSTDEGVTDSMEYVYFEQVHPDSIKDQGFIDNDKEWKDNDNASNSSDDSISQEFAATNLINREADNSAKNSFFTKYFDSKSIRNFNTSKVLDSSDHDSSRSDDGEVVGSIEAVELDCDKNVCDITAEEPRVVENLIDNEDPESKNSCPECGKVISDLEYQSHLDYHFAIKMVRNEAHLYKAECIKQPPSVKPLKPSDKQKRKDNDGVKSKPIIQYLSQSTSTNVGIKREEESGQSCPECKKRIRLDDWDVHIDFHAAKKLHLEMNVRKVMPVNAGGTSKTKVKGQKDIMGFFKRT